MPLRGGSPQMGAPASHTAEIEDCNQKICRAISPDASPGHTKGGRCPRPAAALRVYGLLFCEVHGAEARAAALVEMYQDAADWLEVLDNPHVAQPNPAALYALHSAVKGLEAAVIEAQEAQDAALPRAYPWIEERVDTETFGFDWTNPDGHASPDAVFWGASQLVCKLMRLAYAEGAIGLVEALEPYRESSSAQYAFALEDCERKTRRGA